MAQISPHEWLLPRLTALVAEAEAAGIARDVSVAVITDLINGPSFSAAPVVDDEDWNRDIGEPDYEVNQDATIAPGTAGGAAADLSGLTHYPIHRDR